MHELVETACAPSPIAPANSASKALHSGPCVRMCPDSTFMTALRSSSVIQGRPNGISRLVSVIVFDPRRSSGGQRAISCQTGGHHVELVSGPLGGILLVDDSLDEARNESTL